MHPPFSLSRKVRIIHILLIGVGLSLFYIFAAHWLFHLFEQPISEFGFFETPPDTYDPLADCVTPFGTLLGVANDTPAFSNCNRVFQSQRSNFFSPEDPFDVSRPTDIHMSSKTMVGDKYNALDFVMRWMLRNRGLAPVLMDNIMEMWGFSYFVNPFRPGQTYSADFLVDYKEGETLAERTYLRPLPSDLIIYDENRTRGFSKGHIAVVVSVKNDIEFAGGPLAFKEMVKTGVQPWILYLAEQNNANTVWETANYSRLAYLRWRVREGQAPEVIIVDPSGLSVIGRMRVGKLRPATHIPDRYQEEVDRRDDL